jgi:hypothetical protein
MGWQERAHICSLPSHCHFDPSAEGRHFFECDHCKRQWGVKYVTGPFEHNIYKVTFVCKIGSVELWRYPE